MATKKSSTKKATARSAPGGKVIVKKASRSGAAKAKAAPSRGRKTNPVALPTASKPARGSKAVASKKQAERDADPSGRPDVGDAAPSFVLPDHNGTLVSSESLRGAPYVIYFYPKDDTPGCTLQACGFRDALSRFVAKGVHVVGVSPDSKESHARFRKKYELTFPLLSDPEKTLAKAYGVWVKKQNYGREYMGVERSTFYVDRHGTIRKVWRRVRVPGHVDEVVHSV